MKIDIEYLEKLSKLEIDPEQKETFSKEFERILDFIDAITKLDLFEEDKTISVSVSSLREDEIGKEEKVDALLNAPVKLDGCFVAPLVVE